jgi:hypothetical protein
MQPAFMLSSLKNSSCSTVAAQEAIAVARAYLFHFFLSLEFHVPPLLSSVYHTLCHALSVALALARIRTTPIALYPLYYR